jgi:hypothetical protein
MSKIVLKYRIKYYINNDSVDSCYYEDLFVDTLDSPAVCEVTL